ncbi:MAG TPA: ABC transporter substrate-binding protein [Burkholderiaceae bacterium]|nr:ABC transporter substrate-binding protein [Burkholderiaceae bacterium]
MTHANHFLCRRRLLAGLCWGGVAGLSLAQGASPVRVAIDAEFGHATSTSAEAIRRGAEIAIDEVNRAGGVLAGRPLALEIRDNRGVPTRAVQNVRELAAQPDVVAVITGKFSPAVIECVPLVHELKLPLLAAWSAADGIVDNGHRPNYVFRLSLRDDWAIEVMLRRARALGARRIGLMLPNTAWGRSSLAAAERRLAADGRAKLVAPAWYNWGDKSLLPAYQQLRQGGADILLLVANELEGSILVNEMAALPPSERMPVLGHWGVTGGRFFEAARTALGTVDFSVVQTYSFIGRSDPAARRVLAALRERFGVEDARRVEAPVGVAHAYDLVHLLAQAIRQAGSADRDKVREALERLRGHQGLVRHYAQPFTASRHEALDPSVVFLARYAPDGALLRIDDR